jgi:hypothetical protein
MLGGWFWSYPFSTVDNLTPDGDSNSVMASSSYFTQPARASNYFISPSVKLGLHDTLFWKSAPYQTPRYLDGYKVMISTTTNNIANFTDTLFKAAQMIGNPATDPDTVFADFTFFPTGAFVHGEDGLYIDIASTTTPVSHVGQLRPFSVPLDAYADQNVFITFYHDSYDDNLISIDDIMVRGTLPSGIYENNLAVNIEAYPNPVVNNNIQLNFELPSETFVAIVLYDYTGRIVYSDYKGLLPQGHHFTNINTTFLAKGYYTVAVLTNDGRSIKKLIVQ